MKKFLLLISLAFALFVYVLPISAQTLAAQCGDILEGEFTENNQIFKYSIQMRAGDNLTLTGSTYGTFLNFGIAISEPTNRSYISEIEASNDPTLTTGILSANGIYTVYITNLSGGYDLTQATDDRAHINGGGVGVYTLYIGCTLRDGIVIDPGTTQSLDGPTSQQLSTSAPAFSGYGFPGLAPVEFDNLAKLPLPAGVAMGGAVTSTGSEIIGYTLSASAGSMLSLGFTRLSGNLNLGLVLIHGENQIVYQASLITAQMQNTLLSLPFDGEYTIAVFRINLLPPSDPQATSFQIQADVK